MQKENRAERTIASANPRKSRAISLGIMAAMGVLGLALATQLISPRSLAAETTDVEAIATNLPLQQENHGQADASNISASANQQSLGAAGAGSNAGNRLEAAGRLFNLKWSQIVGILMLGAIPLTGIRVLMIKDLQKRRSLP